MDRPKLPPPFIIFSYLLVLFQWVIREIGEKYECRKVSGEDGKEIKRKKVIYGDYLLNNMKYLVINQQFTVILNLNFKVKLNKINLNR